jgi:hypothetical protein
MTHQVQLYRFVELPAASPPCQRRSWLAAAQSSPQSAGKSAWATSEVLRVKCRQREIESEIKGDKGTYPPGIAAMGMLTLISVSSPALPALEGNRYHVDALPTRR